MTDNSNIVLKWAEIILDKADAALGELEGTGYESAVLASVQVAQIKGVCLGIIAAVERVECQTAEAMQEREQVGA